MIEHLVAQNDWERAAKKPSAPYSAKALELKEAAKWSLLKEFAPYHLLHEYAMSRKQGQRQLITSGLSPAAAKAMIKHFDSGKYKYSRSSFNMMVDYIPSMLHIAKMEVKELKGYN